MHGTTIVRYTRAMSAPFDYRSGTLCCEGVSLQALADAVGTPFYVYSRSELERAYRAFDAALDGIPHRVCYAVKACSSLGILNVLIGLGAGADIVSAGELVRWMSFIDFRPDNVIMQCAKELGIGFPLKSSFARRSLRASRDMRWATLSGACSKSSRAACGRSRRSRRGQSSMGSFARGLSAW